MKMLVRNGVIKTGTVKDFLCLLVNPATLQLPRIHAPVRGAPGHGTRKIRELWILKIRANMAIFGAVSKKMHKVLIYF